MKYKDLYKKSIEIMEYFEKEISLPLNEYFKFSRDIVIFNSDHDDLFVKHITCSNYFHSYFFLIFNKYTLDWVSNYYLPVYTGIIDNYLPNNYAFTVAMLSIILFNFPIIIITIFEILKSKSLSSEYCKN
jgi:hypothetical protein